MLKIPILLVVYIFPNFHKTMSPTRANCRGCCNVDDVNATPTKYPRAILEVCGWRLGAFPQVQGKSQMFVILDWILKVILFLFNPFFIVSFSSYLTRLLFIFLFALILSFLSQSPLPFSSFLSSILVSLHNIDLVLQCPKNVDNTYYFSLCL